MSKLSGLSHSNRKMDSAAPWMLITRITIQVLYSKGSKNCENYQKSLRGIIAKKSCGREDSAADFDQNGDAGVQEGHRKVDVPGPFAVQLERSHTPLTKSDRNNQIIPVLTCQLCG